MNRRSFMLATLSLLGGTAALAQPDDVAAKLKRLQQKAKRESVMMADPDLRPLQGVQPIDAICTLKTLNGRLRLTSPLARGKNADAELLVSIEGYPESAVVFAEGAGKDLEFRLSTKSFSDAKAISIDTQLSLESGVLSINRTARYIDGFLNVSFIQAEGNPEETGFEHGIVFSVNHHPQKGEPTSENLNAATFAELRTRHPDLVNNHLRPILKDLQLASAFNVELAQAFEVFAEDWKPTTEAREKVTKLLPRLDAEKRVERDAALRELYSLAYDGALAVMQLDRTALSPEQNARLDVLLTPLSTLTDRERKAFRRRPHFLCDCLYSEDARVASSAARRLEQLTGKPVEVDLTQPPTRRAPSVEKLRERTA